VKNGDGFYVFNNSVSPTLEDFDPPAEEPNPRLFSRRARAGMKAVLSHVRVMSFKLQNALDDTLKSV